MPLLLHVIHQLCLLQVAKERANTELREAQAKKQQLAQQLQLLHSDSQAAQAASLEQLQAMEVLHLHDI